MNAPLPPLLPASWVDRIFDRMQGLYGSLWVDRWRTGVIDGQGRDIGLLNAKATWCAELGRYANEPHRITRGLDGCRAKALPPTLPEFCTLCDQNPEVIPAPHKALPRPKVDPNAIAEKLAGLQEVANKPAGYDHKGWARKILASPKDYPEISRKFATEALGMNDGREAA